MDKKKVFMYGVLPVAVLGTALTAYSMFGGKQDTNYVWNGTDCVSQSEQASNENVQLYGNLEKCLGTRDVQIDGETVKFFN